MEDDFRWKTTFDGRRSSMVDDQWREKTELVNWRLHKTKSYFLCNSNIDCPFLLNRKESPTSKPPNKN